MGRGEEEREEEGKGKGREKGEERDGGWEEENNLYLFLLLPQWTTCCMACHPDSSSMCISISLCIHLYIVG